MQAVGSVGLLQAKVIIARNAIVICQCDLCHAMLRYVMRFFLLRGILALEVMVKCGGFPLCR